MLLFFTPFQFTLDESSAYMNLLSGSVKVRAPPPQAGCHENTGELYTVVDFQRRKRCTNILLTQTEILSRTIMMLKEVIEE